MTSRTAHSQLRWRIAQESARIMAQEHLNDYRLAKLKAAERLGVPGNSKTLPSNQEVAEALQGYQRLFGGPNLWLRLQAQRQAAASAMRLLHEFQPRLVGPVLLGTATDSSEILLHLFHDCHEEVGLFLLHHNIPYETDERTFHSLQLNVPSYHFIAGSDSISLVVFKYADIRWAPPDPVDGRPMRRADLAEVEVLLHESAEPAAF